MLFKFISNNLKFHNNYLNPHKFYFFMSNFYEPAEDTFLLYNILKDVLKENSNTKLNICEIGVGSGYILSNLSKKFENNNYFGSDINEDAIKVTTKNLGNSKIILKNEAFFQGFNNQKFDLIYFNTPYLPCEDNEKFDDLQLIDKAIYGGKYGYEVIEEFILNINDNLSNEGRVYMLYSSLSKPEIIENILKKNLFEFEEVKRESHLFEELIISKITKSNLLKELSSKNINNLKYLASGKHSIVLEGNFEKKEKIIIKIGLEQHLDKEAYFLEKLKNEDFLGHLITKGKGYVVKEKANGLLIGEFILNEKNRNNILKVLNNILIGCFRLDELKINKFEMTNPYKHIFVEDNFKIKMIDFERSTFNENPKNITQVLQYFLRQNENLIKKGININSGKVYEISKKYKKDWKKFEIIDILDYNY